MAKGSIFFGDLTRKELRELVSSGTVKGAIVPIGSCEQHDEHLAMINDTDTVTEIARRVAFAFYPQVLVTPTVSMAVSEHHMNVGGALTIRPEVVVEYLHDVCLSLKRLGVPKIMVLNGHGGNKRENLEPVAPEGIKKLDELGVTYVTYWQTLPPSFYEANLEHDRSAGHAGEFETSLALLLFQHHVRPKDVANERAKTASVSKGCRILDAIVQGVAERVRRMLGEG